MNSFFLPEFLPFIFNFLWYIFFILTDIHSYSITELLASRKYYTEIITLDTKQQILYTYLMRYLTNSLTLIFSFFAIFLEEKSLSDYRTQIIGLLIIVYFLIRFIRSKDKKKKENFSTGADIFIINTIVILLIITTGGLYSPIFSIVYFVCFGITFIFEPITVFIFAIGVALIFLPEALQNHATESFIKIGSIFLTTPLAFFFGKEYKDRERTAKKLMQIKNSSEKIDKDADIVIKKGRNIDDTFKISNKLKK